MFTLDEAHNLTKKQKDALLMLGEVSRADSLSEFVTIFSAAVIHSLKELELIKEVNVYEAHLTSTLENYYVLTEEGARLVQKPTDELLYLDGLNHDTEEIENPTCPNCTKPYKDWQKDPHPNIVSNEIIYECPECGHLFRIKVKPVFITY